MWYILVTLLSPRKPIVLLSDACLFSWDFSLLEAWTRKYGNLYNYIKWPMGFILLQINLFHTFGRRISIASRSRTSTLVWLILKLVCTIAWRELSCGMVYSYSHIKIEMTYTKLPQVSSMWNDNLQQVVYHMICAYWKKNIHNKALANEEICIPCFTLLWNYTKFC